MSACFCSNGLRIGSTSNAKKSQRSQQTCDQQPHIHTFTGVPMRVSELIDILSDYPPDMEVELAIVAPDKDTEEDIAVDRYVLDGVMPWVEETEDGPESSVWLIGGEESDVEAFLDAIEIETETIVKDDHA